MTTAYSSARAYLTDPGDWTYEFRSEVGGVPLLVLNDQDEQGCLWACDEPEGSHAPAAVTPMDDRPYGDGAYAGETTFEPRPLTWEGTTTCPDRPALFAAMQRLRTVASTRVPVLYTQAGYPPKSLWLRATGQPKMRPFEGMAFDWAFTLVAEDPLWFDAAELAPEVVATRTIGLPLSQSGRIYNKVYNYVYGSSSATDLSIVNAGDEWAQALFTITGPVVNPVILNATTGEFLGVIVELGANDTLTVDTASELMTYNGQPFYAPTTLGSSMPRLAPGANVLRWSAAANNTQARLTVATASTWK